MQTHTTRTGESIPISHMDDSHLTNTIAMMADQMSEQLSILEGTYQAEDEVSSLLSYRSNDATTLNNARTRYHALYQQLGAYCTEACVRNLDVSEAIYPAFRRDKKVRTLRRSQRALEAKSRRIDDE